MPEYIDRNKLIPDRCYYEPDGYEAVSCEQIFHEGVADVVEREKINNAIDKIDFLRQRKAKYITEDNKICIDSEEVLKILKEI